MTISSAAHEGLSFAELSQKVIALGGFVQRLPGGRIVQDMTPFAERGDGKSDETAHCEVSIDPSPNGYDQGFADGFAKAETEMRGQLAAMQRLLAEAQALQVEPTAEIAHMICDLVERLVTPICEKMPVTRQWLLHQLDKAMPSIAECAEAQTLWLNPDDAQLLEGVDLPMDIQTDPAMPRATLQIRSSMGYLETGISPFIQKIHDALDLSEVE